MNDITVYDRTPYIVFLDPVYKHELLRVANCMADRGFHVETMLSLKPCIFGTLPSEVDPGDAFNDMPEVTSWTRG